MKQYSNDFNEKQEKIFNAFGIGFNEAKMHELTKDDFSTILDVLSSYYPSSSASENQIFTVFLYAGCRKFDRWVLPSPLTVTDQDREQFSKFVSALMRMSKASPGNFCMFEVHKIKSEIHYVFDGVPITSIDRDKISGFERRLAAIKLPDSEMILSDVAAEIKICQGILDGLKDGSLQTELRFSVPYVVHKNKLDLSMTRRGTVIHVEISPHFETSGDCFVGAEGGVTLSSGASRWQGGTSQVVIWIDAFIDGSAFTERLQAVAGLPFIKLGWPKSFTTAFEIFHDVAWQLRELHGGQRMWIPAPRDISAIQYCCNTAEISQIGWVVKSSPAALTDFFSPSPEVLKLDLEELSPFRWSIECRARATMYLELGDTNESLFWLNVGVEALISARFSEIEELTGIVGLVKSLESPKEFWAGAEEVVAAQFPEMAGKTEWPSADIHVSVYGKLKALYRNVSMRTSFKQLEVRYKRVSSERNDLFHGRRTDRLLVSEVEAVFTAFDWVDHNMWPER